MNLAGLDDGETLVWDAGTSKFVAGAGAGGGPTEMVHLSSSVAVQSSFSTQLTWGNPEAEGHFDTIDSYKTDGTTPSLSWVDPNSGDALIVEAGLYLVETTISIGATDASSTVQITTSLGTVNTNGLGTIVPKTNLSACLTAPFMAPTGDVPCFPQVTASVLGAGGMGSSTDWFASMWIVKLG